MRTEDVLMKVLESVYGEGFCISCHQPVGVEDEDDSYVDSEWFKVTAEMVTDLENMVGEELDDFDDRLRRLELRVSEVGVKADRMWNAYMAAPTAGPEILCRDTNRTIPSILEIKQILFGDDQTPEPRVFNPHADVNCDEANCCGGKRCCE